MIGIVKWFDDKKGFGFIDCEDSKEDIFVHFTQIQRKGYKTLNEGQKVEFDIYKTKNGLRASNVKNMSN